MQFIIIYFILAKPIRAGQQPTIVGRATVGNVTGAGSTVARPIVRPAKIKGNYFN